MTKPDFTFVIDTNSYAGNFERQMCGFMTGDGGEYGYKDVDDIFRAEVGDDHPLGDIVEYRVDDSDDVPVHAPVRVWPNPRWFNNGSGGHFRRDDEDADAKALAAKKKWTIEYAEKNLKRAKTSSWKQESIDREVAQYEREIEKAKAMTEVVHYPAYNSVGIFMRARPTDEQIAFLKARARLFVEFCKANESARWFRPDNLEIEGFRLVEETMTEKSTDL